MCVGSALGHIGEVSRAYLSAPFSGPSALSRDPPPRALRTPYPSGFLLYQLQYHLSTGKDFKNAFAGSSEQPVKYVQERVAYAPSVLKQQDLLSAQKRFSQIGSCQRTLVKLEQNFLSMCESSHFSKDERLGPRQGKPNGQAPSSYRYVCISEAFCRSPKCCRGSRLPPGAAGLTGSLAQVSILSSFDPQPRFPKRMRSAGC